MKERFDDRLYISKSLPHFLEFASPDVTKAAGLEFVAERLGFSAERTVAFGDGENDVELLDWAGYGIAVANADERLLAIADWVCPPVGRGGSGAGDRDLPRRQVRRLSSIACARLRARSPRQFLTIGASASCSQASRPDNEPLRQTLLDSGR